MATFPQMVEIQVGTREVECWWDSGVGESTDWDTHIVAEFEAWDTVVVEIG